MPIGLWTRTGHVVSSVRGVTTSARSARPVVRQRATMSSRPRSSRSPSSSRPPRSPPCPSSTSSRSSTSRRSVRRLATSRSASRLSGLLLVEPSLSLLSSSLPTHASRRLRRRWSARRQTPTPSGCSPTRSPSRTSKTSTGTTECATSARSLMPTTRNSRRRSSF